MIIMIVILSLFGCGIIGVGIYLIVDYIQKNKKQSPYRHPSHQKKSKKK